MNFKDQRVRRRVVEHINFAIAAVKAALPEAEEGSASEEINAMKQVAEVPLILAVLNFTLGLDYQLRNTFAPTDAPGISIPHIVEGAE